MHTIIMNSTEVRKNFFTVLGRVVNEGIEVIVENKNLSSNVRIIVDKLKSAKRSNDMGIVDELKGSLKSDIPYNPNESQIAHELYAKHSVFKK